METNNEQENKFGFKVVDEFITNNLALSMTCSIIALLNLLMGQLLFKVSSLTFAVIFSTFTVIIYLKYKDIASEGVNKLYFTSLKIIMPLISMLIINGLFLTFVRNVSRDNLLAVGGLCIMMDIIIIGGFLMLYSQEELMNNLKVLHEKKLGSTNSIENDEEIQPGDAVLGYAIDEDGKSTKKPVILPLKDRFLHMLILGPTGCGKTSQSVIPMINRDMQNPNMGITVLEPKGDLAEKIFAMAKHYNREVLYFNPTLPDCPYFNPLYGKESDVVENMATTFNMLNPDSPQFFKDMSEGLIRRSIKILKRVYGNDATLLHLSDLVWNTEERGEIIIEMLQVAKNNFVDPEVQKENDELVYWYSTDYYSGLSGDRGASKTFEHCSGVRSQISKLVSNKYLRKVLNPPPGVGSDLDFDDAFERGTIVTMGTAQGELRELGRYLGYFIILQLQSSVFKRPGNENTRTHNMLYIDEFQVYANPGFADMLTMGRSYRVASHLATQARAQIGMGGGNDGKAFVELVSTNARNKIIYPGVSSQDAKYYSDEFGEVLKVTENKAYSQSRFFSKMSDKKVTMQTTEEMDTRFTLNDIIYREFGEITYCIIKNNSIQTPGVSKIEYIPYELNTKLDKMIADYTEEQKQRELDIEEQRILSFSKNVTNLENKNEEATDDTIDETEHNTGGFIRDSKTETIKVKTPDADIFEEGMVEEE